MCKLQSDNSDQPKDRNLYSIVVNFFCFFFGLFLLLLLFVNPGAINWGFFFSSLTMCKTSKQTQKMALRQGWEWTFKQTAFE